MIVILCHCRHLDIGQRGFIATQRRQNHHREDDHADTADPVRRRAPEEQSARQCLDIIQNRCSRCRKARNTLEPSIDQRELAAPNQIGEHTDHARQQPSTHDDAVALLVGHRGIGILIHEDQREDSQHERQHKRD